MLSAQVKENPGKNAVWHMVRIVSVGLNDVEYVLEVLLETGGAFKWTQSEAGKLVLELLWCMRWTRTLVGAFMSVRSDCRRIPCRSICSISRRLP